MHGHSDHRFVRRPLRPHPGMHREPVDYCVEQLGHEVDVRSGRGLTRLDKHAYQPPAQSLQKVVGLVAQGTQGRGHQRLAGQS